MTYRKYNKHNETVIFSSEYRDVYNKVFPTLKRIQMKYSAKIAVSAKSATATSVKVQKVVDMSGQVAP